MDKKMIEPKKFEGMSIYRPPLCHELAGRTFELAMDSGFDYCLKVKDRETLCFHKVRDAEKQYRFDCLKVEKFSYFVNFEEPGLQPRVGFTLILDLEQSLVTMAVARLGLDPKFPCMPSIDFIFGWIKREDGLVPKIRHGYTRDMVGTAINWNYGTFDVGHVYASERYYRVAFTPKRLEQMRREAEANGRTPPDNPSRGVCEDYASYIKIKDGIYVLSLLETQLCRTVGHGNSLLFLMNLKEMHDVGRSFGTNNDLQGENYTFGAFGEYFEASDTLAKTSNYFIR